MSEPCDKSYSDDEEGFSSFIGTQVDHLAAFRLSRKQVTQTNFGACPFQFQSLVWSLVESFKSGHRIGRFKMDAVYFEILFEEKGLNHAGIKAVLWTLYKIFKESENPLNFFQTDAILLARIVKGFQIPESDPKWDIIELTTILRRLLHYLPLKILQPVTDLVNRLMDQKYKWIPQFETAVDVLKLGDFYPRNCQGLESVAKKLLKNMSVESVIRRNWEELESLQSEQKGVKGADLMAVDTRLNAIPPPPVIKIEATDEEIAPSDGDPKPGSHQQLLTLPTRTNNFLPTTTPLHAEVQIGSEKTGSNFVNVPHEHNNDIDLGNDVDISDLQTPPRRSLRLRRKGRLDYQIFGGRILKLI